MGFGFRIAPGVRVYPGGRGLGVSVGKGPLRYSARVGGRSRSTARGSSRTSVAAHERQVRQAQRLQEFQAVLAIDQQLIELCQAHHQSFEPARRPLVLPPEPVDVREVRRRLETEAVADISVFQLGHRRSAKREAASRVDAEIEAEQLRRDQGVAELQAQLDDQWVGLQANDPDVVLGALEQAFEDNEAPAAAVSCRDRRVDLVMRWPAEDEVVPERKAATTPSGQPTIHKRNKAERVEFYLEALCSNLLVTAKEAFAICPSIDEIGLAAIRATRDLARGDEIVEPVFLGTMRRDQLEGIRWENVVAIAALLETAAGRIGMKGKAANKTLYGLDLSDDVDEREFIRQIADGLGCRVPDGGVAGLGLPVNVVNRVAIALTHARASCSCAQICGR